MIQVKHSTARLLALYVLLLLVCTIFGTGCAKQIPDYPLRDVGSYNHKDVHVGIAVACEVVAESKKQKTYFRTNLVDKGILPIFVVVANESSSVPVHVKPENFTIASLSSAAGNEVADTGGGKAIGVASLALLSIPLALVSATVIRDAENIQANFRKKSLRSQIISRGQLASGFVYFDTKELESETYQLQAVIHILNQGEELIFNIPFRFEAN